MRVLLTNDDGIEAAGLRALHRALRQRPDISLAVIAPDGNRSGMARSITTRRPLWVEEVDLGAGDVGYATDGTPVDCVRLASLGLIDGWTPDVVVAGINHGPNIGDDITYSGTVAAALEALVLGITGIAVSQRPRSPDADWHSGSAFDFAPPAEFTSRLLTRIGRLGLETGALLNVNFPGCEPQGVTVARLGRRSYYDQLELVGRDGPARRCFHVYGERAGAANGDLDTDIAALAARQVAITPLHFDLTDHPGLAALAGEQLGRLLAP